MSIKISSLSKSFGNFPAISDINLKIETGEMVAFLGPSGSGKTTLLRIIAGLEFADDGDIFFEGENVSKKNANERKAGFVFQSYALFNHMTIFENIAFGLQVAPRRKRLSKEKIRERVLSLLETIQLSGLEKRFPAQLSGGQRQRIAFARALAVEPRILLLDEPFGALDAKVRRELRTWLTEFHHKTQLTSLFVTHDQEEAFDVAHRVVIIHQGIIQQIGSPEEVRRHPANAFIRDFLALP
jgi:sulfate transport system ATP-binding protein